MLLWCFVLTLIFVVLKLNGNIAWSWAVVLMPLWIPLLFSGLFVFFLLLFVACAFGGK